MIVLSEEINEMITIPAFEYIGDEEKWVTSTLIDGCETFTFSYLKAKIKVWHKDGVIIYAQPTRKMDPWDTKSLHITNRTGYFTEKIGDQSYAVSPRANRKEQVAYQMLIECWRVDSTPEHLFMAIGKRSGHCAICGCELTVDESKQRGIGPECIKHIGAGKWEAMLLKIKASEVKSV
jgi:hypothetical protein